jgi:hypothetical protein
MPKIEFEDTRIEIPSPRNGRPSYRWVDALYVIVDGKKLYPPMRIREAKNFAERLKNS